MVAPGLRHRGVPRRGARRDPRPASRRSSSTRIAEQTIRAAGGVPNFKKEPGYRHTLCVVGERRGRARHPGRAHPAARRHRLGRQRRRARRLERRRGVHRRRARSRTARARRGAAAALGCHRARRSGRHRRARPATPPQRGRRRRSRTPSTRAGEFGILEDYVGHGIGRSMHEDPPVFNYRVRASGPRGEARPRRRDRADGRARRHRHPRARRRLDRRHRRRRGCRALGALASPCTPTASGCSPPRTAARRASPRSASVPCRSRTDPASGLVGAGRRRSARWRGYHSSTARWWRNARE